MAQQFVQAKIKGDKVVLFIKPTCSYCVTAREVLLKYKFKPGHLEFVDISARQDMTSLQDYFMELTGARTVSTTCYRIKVNVAEQTYAFNGKPLHYCKHVCMSAFAECR